MNKYDNKTTKEILKEIEKLKKQMLEEIKQTKENITEKYKPIIEKLKKDRQNKLTKEFYKANYKAITPITTIKCLEMFGKNHKYLSMEEKRQYDKLKQREYRKKQKQIRDIKTET